MVSNPLIWCRFVGAAVALCGLLFVSGCAEELGPGKEIEGYTVWIAQKVEGKVEQAVTRDPIPDAQVTLQAGFDEGALIPIGSTRTSDLGTFSFLASDRSGIAGDFYWFVVPDRAERNVFVRVTVHQGLYFPASNKQIVTRIPSESPPTRDLGEYQLAFNVVMQRAPGN